MSEYDVQFAFTEPHFLLTTYSKAYIEHLTNKAEKLNQQTYRKLHLPQQVMASVAGASFAFGMYRHFLRYQGYKLLGFAHNPVPWSGMSACILFMGYFGYTYGSKFYHDILVGKQNAKEMKHAVHEAFSRRDGFVEMSKSYQSGSIQSEWKQGLYK